METEPKDNGASQNGETKSREQTEEDVQIQGYASPDVKGFSAIVKHRFSDFNVFEIDLQNRVVQLESAMDPSKVE